MTHKSPSEQVATLTATVDQLQAEIDMEKKINTILLLSVIALTCIVIVRTKHASIPS